MCDEIFGTNNFIAQFTRKGSGGRQDSKYYAVVHEYVLCYSRNYNNFISGKIIKTDESYPFYDERKGLNYKTQLLRKWGENSRRIDRPNLFYPITDPDGNEHYPMLNNIEEGCWRWGKSTMNENIKKGLVEFKQRNGTWVAYEKIYEPTGDDVKTKLYTTIIDDISNNTGAALLKELLGGKIFDYPKPVDLIYRILKLANTDKDSIILDFFSGSATTAHATMQMNADDGGWRKFIMVQLNEFIDPESETYLSGYNNICEIGKERIRRAGRKILTEVLSGRGSLDGSGYGVGIDNYEEYVKATGDRVLDIGFRVLKLDSANEKDVKRTPSEYPVEQGLFDAMLDDMVENIKDERTPEDLLFQVLPMCNLPLSCKIETQEIDGKCVFIVEEGYLIACFDNDINENVITEIAKMKPYYFVMRDSSLATDNVADNFDQIFNAYSKDTIRRIL